MRLLASAFASIGATIALMDDKQAAGQSQDAQEFRPGEMISPSQSSSAPAPMPELPAPVVDAVPQNTTEPIPSPQPSVTPAAPVVPSTPVAPIVAHEPSLAPSGPQADMRQSLPTEPPLFQWTSPEFVAHDKPPAWYLALFGASAVIAALVFLFTKDKISTAVVLVVGVALGTYAARKPREIDHALFEDSMMIGQKTMGYEQFRSFSLDDEGAFASLVLVPHRRFGQLVTLYFQPQDEDRIVAVISRHLPLEQRPKDLVDNFMKKIRF